MADRYMKKLNKVTLKEDKTQNKGQRRGENGTKKTNLVPLFSLEENFRGLKRFRGRTFAFILCVESWK